MKQVITRLIDDLDQSDADETVTFSLDGVQYEIDLSGVHAGELREALAPFVNAGTKVGRSSGKPHAVNVQPKGNRRHDAAVRHWYHASYPVLVTSDPKLPAPADRGRIPVRVRDLFAEHGGLQVRPDAAAIRAAVERVNPAGDGLDAMKVGELRRLAAERGFSSLTRSPKQAIVATLRANPDGPPAMAQNKVPKAAEKPAQAPVTPDLDRYTPAQRRELNEQARRFAKLHKVEVAARGRVPAAVMAAYEANDPSLLPQG